MKNVILKSHISLIFFVLKIFFAQTLFAQNQIDILQGIEFKDRDAKEILKILASENSINLIADETVEGKTSFFLENATKENALETFIESKGLFATKKDGVLYVSKIKCQFDKKNNRLDLLCNDVNFENIKKALQKEIGATIICNENPKEKISLYITNLMLEDAFKIICSSLGQFNYKIEKSFIEIYKTTSPQNKIIKTDDKDSEVKFYKVSNSQAQTIISAIPKELYKPGSISADNVNNMIIISGAKEENEELIDFIRLYENESGDIKWKMIKCNFVNAKKIAEYFPQNILKSNYKIIEDANSIMFYGTKESINFAENIISKLDVDKKVFPIKLKNIRSKELLENLPPAATKETVIESGIPDLVFYIGPEENLKILKAQIAQIDVVKPQIKYQILIVQYNKTNGKNFKNTFTANSIDEESASENYVLNGELSNIFSMNFDVISHFGWQFASILNAQISQTQAKVFSDATLTALSGEEIKFQNTDTHRYIEYEYDKTTGTTKNGTTQQITSGLIIELEGWISNNQEITVDINATVSKQNGLSTSTGSSLQSLPSTSERIISTKVRTQNGKPIVISGLIKEDETESFMGVPLLNKIPILKNMFSHSSRSKEKTELVIYLVPRIVKDAEQYSSEERIKNIYKTIME